MHQRSCMYCGTPITKCFGFVLPRDVLAALEGTLPEGQYPRELCSNISCHNKWKQALANETGDDSYLEWI
jgi:hypothetical protein